MTCGTCGKTFTVGPAPDLCHECGRALRVAEMLRFGMREPRIYLDPRPATVVSRRRGRFLRPFVQWVMLARSMASGRNRWSGRRNIPGNDGSIPSRPIGFFPLRARLAAARAVVGRVLGLVKL